MEKFLCKSEQFTELLFPKATERCRSVSHSRLFRNWWWSRSGQLCRNGVLSECLLWQRLSETIHRCLMQPIAKNFEKWGWLTPTKQIVNDYGTDTLSVTQRDIETLNKEISSLHLPLLTDAVEYLTDKNLHLYQHPQTPMTGNVQYNNAGTIHITDSQGIVAFEVFNENTLVGVSHNTTFKLPTNQSYDFDKLRIIAILPNGKRIEYNGKSATL